MSRTELRKLRQALQGVIRTATIPTLPEYEGASNLAEIQAAAVVAYLREIGALR